jgi:hypothetical protein
VQTGASCVKGLRPPSASDPGLPTPFSPGGVRLVSKSPGPTPGLSAFPAFCGTFVGALGRTRTCDLLIRRLGVRSLVTFTGVRKPPQVSRKPLRRGLGEPERI